MADFYAPHPVAPESVTIHSLSPELSGLMSSLQIENTRMKYLLREIDGKEVCRVLTGCGIPSLDIAEMIEEWELNRTKFIGEIVAHVFKQLYNGNRNKGEIK